MQRKCKMHSPYPQVNINSTEVRQLHGDGDDGITAVMGLDFMTDTAIIAGMGTAFTVVSR